MDRPPFHPPQTSSSARLSTVVAQDPVAVPRGRIEEACERAEQTNKNVQVLLARLSNLSDRLTGPAPSAANTGTGPRGEPNSQTARLFAALEDTDAWLSHMSQVIERLEAL